MTDLGPQLAAAAPALDVVEQRILDSARAAFVDHGFRRTSMDDIATKAQVSRATLFRRFSGRDALVQALLLREARRTLDAMSSAAEQHTAMPDRVAAAFTSFLRLLRGDDLLQRVLRTDAERLLPMLTIDGAPILALTAGWARDLLADAQTSGFTLTADPELLAELVGRIGMSFALTADTSLPLDDEDALAAFARDVLVPMVLRPT